MASVEQAKPGNLIPGHYIETVGTLYRVDTEVGKKLARYTLLKDGWGNTFVPFYYWTGKAWESGIRGYLETYPEN